MRSLADRSVGSVHRMNEASSTIMVFRMGDDGIVRATSLPGIQPTAELLAEAEDACRIVRGGRRRPAVWDIRDLVKPNPMAWMAFMENAPNNLLAIAILGDTQHIEVLGSIPQVIGRFLLPIAVFTDEIEAVEWAAGFID